MDILFLLLGFSHQSAQCINTSCSTSSLSPWFCLAGRRAFGLSCALFLGSWRMWQQLLHVQPSLSPSQTAGCCLTRRAYIQWVRPSAPGHIQSSLAPGMNEFAIWDGPCSPFVCGPAKPSTCPPGGSILLLLCWTSSFSGFSGDLKSCSNLIVFLWLPSSFFQSSGTSFVDQDIDWILYCFWLLTSCQGWYCAHQSLGDLEEFRVFILILLQEESLSINLRRGKRIVQVFT